MLKKLAILILGITVTCSAQERFQSGEFKGFTKSPTEHIICRIEEPFTVPSVQGTIVFRGKDDPLSDVAFEIRGPGSQERIRATKTDSAGHFKNRHVPEGTYTFKATRYGFQSVVGKIILSRKANRKNTIDVQMPIGV
ncbi:MAG: carboxypeptidase-like regulatory domain-containing protein [Terriglobia bacterium]